MKRNTSLFARRAVWILFFLFSSWAPLMAQKVQIKTSELFEAFFLLNHLGNDSDPHPMVQFWKKHRSEETHHASLIWKGRAYDLVRLFYPMKDEPIAHLIEELKNPTAIQGRLMAVHESNLPEMAYFQKNHDSLLIYLQALQSAKFEDFWKTHYNDSIQEIAQKIRGHFLEFDGEAFAKNFYWFAGTNTTLPSELSLYLLAMTPDQKLALPEKTILFSMNLYPSFPTAWTHLLFQQIPISAENIDRVKILSYKKYYRKISRRIHPQYPLEEEYHFAASLYLAHQSKILSSRDALFQLKMAYPHSEDPLDTGAPLAALIFQKLLETSLEPYKNYDAFLSDLWKTQAIPVKYLTRNAQMIWEEVAGASGLLLQQEQKNFKIAFILAGHFSSLTGIQPGDLVLNIDDISLANKTLMEALSLLAGYHGEEKTLTLKRAEEILIQKIYLD